jgi:hypothetical protein
MVKIVSRKGLRSRFLVLTDDHHCVWRVLAAGAGRATLKGSASREFYGAAKNLLDQPKPISDSESVR